MAEKLFGIEFTDAQEAMALNGVNRNLDSYEANRKNRHPSRHRTGDCLPPARAKKQLYSAKTKFRLGNSTFLHSSQLRIWPSPAFPNLPN